MCVCGGGGGSPKGALSGQVCTDARTKDCKTYPKQCARHFEFIPLFTVSSQEVTLSTVVN